MKKRKKMKNPHAARDISLAPKRRRAGPKKNKKNGKKKKNENPHAARDISLVPERRRAGPKKK